MQAWRIFLCTKSDMSPSQRSQDTSSTTSLQISQLSSIHTGSDARSNRDRCRSVCLLHKCMSFKLAVSMEAPCPVHCGVIRLSRAATSLRVLVTNTRCACSFQLFPHECCASGFALSFSFAHSPAVFISFTCDIITIPKRSRLPLPLV